MCGIAGKINLNNKPVNIAEIKKMTDLIAHRGPDDEGQWVEGNVGLGARRLAIIDLTSAGHMPMVYNDRYVITYNGEIYNFESERYNLQKNGYKFKSNTDTEVIVALYDKYGVDCLKKLRGMFSFAIWDRKNKTLFAARDRLGKKPFKYYIDDNKFIFASELKAIDVSRKLDYEAMWDYLTYQYVPFPNTGFIGISKLEPAHYLILKDNKIQIHKYWDIDYTFKNNFTEEEWSEKILHHLDESVKIRLKSDVPLGVFLSGGVDSSAVVASMALQSDKPVKTFSIGFKESSYNETKYAKMVAKKYNTEHNELIIEPSGLEILPELVNLYEEPYADSSALATYYVSKITREYVTVALNGDGGDENFAGYNSYKYIKNASYFDYIPKLIKKNIFLPGTKILNKLIPNDFTAMGIKYSKSLLEPLWYRYVRYMEYFSNSEKEQLLINPLQKESRYWQGNYFKNAPSKDIIEKALYSDIHAYLAGDLLVKVDLASMGNSLEGRSPLLDHKFMEMTASIPSDLKIKNGEKKYIFKKSLESRLPKELLYRPKMGFGIPIRKWFKSEKYSNYLRDELLNGELVKSGLFSKKVISEIINTNYISKVDYSYRLWALLTLHHWIAIYKPKL